MSKTTEILFIFLLFCESIKLFYSSFIINNNDKIVID